MAGKVPDSETNEVFYNQGSKSPSKNREQQSVSKWEYIGDIFPISKPWDSMSDYPLESSSNNQLQEQYMYSVDKCLTELKRIRRNNEAMFIEVKKTIRDKVENMLKIVKQSFEHMHIDGTKQMELKCEEIGRVLGRIEKFLDEGNQDILAGNTALNGQGSQIELSFLQKAMRSKMRIEEEVENIILNLNNKRKSDEEIFMYFKDDIQQQAHSGILNIERSLESLAEARVKAVEEKILELRKALANLQHLSKFS